MSGHYETVGARDSSADWYAPLETMGGSDDNVPSGKYAVGVDLDDGGAFFVGTLEELETWVGRVQHALVQARAHSLRPLTLSDYDVDEDGNYPCPRCDKTFEPLQQGDLHVLVKTVQKHIDNEHSPIPEGL